MLLSGGGMPYHNKDFAGETFSQISSTFDQFNAQMMPQKLNPTKQDPKDNGGKAALHNQNLEQQKPNAVINYNIPHTNHDELLDYEILNKSSLNSPAEERMQNDISKELNNMGLDLGGL